MLAFLKELFAPKADIGTLIKDGAVIVDVRTAAEFNTGHLEGSKNIPLDMVKKEAASLKKLNKPIVLVCRSGTRSGLAKSILSTAGVEAYNGGAWSSVNK